MIHLTETQFVELAGALYDITGRPLQLQPKHPWRIVACVHCDDGVMFGVDLTDINDVLHIIAPSVAELCEMIADSSWHELSLRA